jgi:glycosyltransferase involved in cell wall biosynthesis
MSVFIAVFFQHMPPYSGAAALRGQSIVASLAHLIADEGGRLIVFCTTSNPTPIKGASIVTLDVSEVENSHGLFRRVLGELRVGYAAVKQIFLAGVRPSLVVVSSPGYISALTQILCARLNGIPYVLEMRDIYPQVYAEANVLSSKNLIYKILQRISQMMYLRAELVLCATQGLAREVLYEAPNSCVKYIYNGFPENFTERSAIKHKRFSVCFHGVLGFFQDIETLLRVTEQLVQHDVDVVVIGYGRKEALLKNCKLANLRFLGRQSFKSTIDEVERCHLGLCLRLDDKVSKDAFPVKVWEYIGLGIPCIVTPRCEAGEFLEKNACGIVLGSGDIPAIVTSILKARDDSSYFNELSSNCRRTSNQFTREKTGMSAAREIYKAAYKSVGQSNEFS